MVEDIAPAKQSATPISHGLKNLIVIQLRRLLNIIANNETTLSRSSAITDIVGAHGGRSGH